MMCISNERIYNLYSRLRIEGAFNKINSLSKQQKNRGVIAASAAIHAQGVANAAKKIGIPCLIVMPITTPDIKVSAVRSFGAKILLYGDNYNESSKKASSIAKQKKMELIHAFDDPMTIAGQGTIGKEILDAEDNLDAVFVPVGGGGPTGWSECMDCTAKKESKDLWSGGR